MTAETAPRPPGASGDSLTVEGQRFAIVPEWVIDADIGDCAFRLYAVLLRYGQSSGRRMPSRATLARRLRKRSVDTVDRAMKELVTAGAVVVERRRDGKQNLTNLYHVRTTAPGHAGAATTDAHEPGRNATAAGRGAAAADSRRIAAASRAALERPDPEPMTQEQLPPTWTALAVRCQELRRGLGLPAARWSASGIALASARCEERGWPAPQFEKAVLAVAADATTRSILRVAEAGPWCDDEPAPARDGSIEAFEARLDGVDGQRAWLQKQARAELAAEGQPLNRSTVVRRAVLLLERMGARDISCSES